MNNEVKYPSRERVRRLYRTRSKNYRHMSYQDFKEMIHKKVEMEAKNKNDKIQHTKGWYNNYIW